MGLLSFTTAPVEMTKQIKKQKSIIAKGIKAKSSRRKVDMGAVVYGDELFQAAYKPTKAIVVKFYPFTLNLIRVETEGRFAIQYYKETDRFLLYRFLNPIQFEYSEVEFQISSTENVKTYGPFEQVTSIRDKILEIIRRQLLEEHTKNKQLAIDLDKAEKLAKEKAQDEADKIAEQLGSTGIQTNNESSERETKIESKEITPEKDLLQETVKEEVTNQLSLAEVRKPTANFITEDSKIVDPRIEEIRQNTLAISNNEIADPVIIEALLEVEDNKIVTIWKREGNQVRLVTKMLKSKAEKWIEGKVNFYIRGK